MNLLTAIRPSLLIAPSLLLATALASGTTVHTPSGDVYEVDLKGWLVCRDTAADAGPVQGYVLVEGGMVEAFYPDRLALRPAGSVLQMTLTGSATAKEFAVATAAGATLPTGRVVSLPAGIGLQRVGAETVALPIEGGFYPDARKPRLRPDLEALLGGKVVLLDLKVLTRVVANKPVALSIPTRAAGPAKPASAPFEVEAAVKQAIAEKHDMIVLRLTDNRYFALGAEPVKSVAGNRVTLKRGRLFVQAIAASEAMFEPPLIHDLMRATLASGYPFNLSGFSGSREMTQKREESVEIVEVLPYLGPPEPAAKQGWKNTVVTIAGGLGHFKHGMASQTVTEIRHRHRQLNPKRAYAAAIIEPLANAGSTGLSAAQENAFLTGLTDQKGLRIVTGPTAGDGDVLVIRPRLYATNDIVVVGLMATDRRSGEVMDWVHGWGWLRPDARDKDLAEFAAACGIPRSF